MSTKPTRGDIVWNYIGTILALGSNFLLLPFIIYYLNEEMLGLWYVFLSIGALVQLFDFGFNPTLARNVAYAWNGAKQLNRVDGTFSEDKVPNVRLLKKVIQTSKVVYFLISLVALIFLLTFGTKYIGYISMDIKTNVHYVAWWIYCIAVFLNLYFGYYTTFLKGVGAVKGYNISTIIARLLQIFVAVILLFLGLDIIAVALAYLLYGLAFRMVSKQLFYTYNGLGSLLKNEKSLIRKSEIWKTFKIIWHNAWRDGLVSLANYLSNQASVLIASFYLSLTETGVYSLSIQLITAIATISGALYTAYQPSLQGAYIKKDIETPKRLMATAMTVYIFAFWIGVLVLVLIGLPFIQMIRPSISINIPILIGIAFYKFLLKHHSFYASYISNTNRVPYVRAFVLSSGLGVLLTWALINYTTLGVWGLIYAQVLVQLVYNNWRWPMSVLKSLDISFFGFIRLGVFHIKSSLMKRIQ